eukprot:553300_1
MKMHQAIVHKMNQMKTKRQMLMTLTTGKRMVKPLMIKADDEDSSSAKKEAKWANLICIVSLNTVFEDWKTYDYSTTDAVKTQNIERKLNHCKDGRGKFKMSGVGTFAYIKKGNPKGYKLAVRCTNNSFPHANDILDQLISGLDAKLETVKKVEKFAKKK